MSSAVIKRSSSKKLQDVESYFATTFAGLEGVLEKELRLLGAADVARGFRGVAFRGDKRMLYSANLWLRSAHRVLKPLAEFSCQDRHGLYDRIFAINWDEHLSPEKTIAVDATAYQSSLDHTQFIAQVVKDAVVDWFRDKTGKRPNVDLKNPNFRLNARIHENHCTLSWDTSGHRLHQRGYRPNFGHLAPLKENLAAGILLLSGYDGNKPLVDPMCGSGTVVVEAAMMAKNMAPGLCRGFFAFADHPSFDRLLWFNLLEEARNAVKEIDGLIVSGYDISTDAVRSARASALGAGVDDVIRIGQAPLCELKSRQSGLLITNPPYGERLGEIHQLAALYKELGDVLKNQCVGISAHVMTGSAFLAKQIGLKTRKRDIIWNGPLECRLLHYDIY